MAARVELEFTVDWFSRHIANWERLRTALPARKKFLELGSFEGLSACWMLENWLDDDGELYCVDTWEGSPEFVALPEGTAEASYDRFCRNVQAVQKANQRVTICRTATVEALAQFIRDGERFDFIYIDAGHQARETLTDACMSWPLLKAGGILIFDDYLWSLQAPLEHRPKCGIDAFVDLFHVELQTLAVGEQYIIRRNI